jgi:hypothetical protein
MADFQVLRVMDNGILEFKHPMALKDFFDKFDPAKIYTIPLIEGEF